MNQLLQILIFTFLLSSCAEKSELEGVWVESHSFNDGEKEALPGNLWEFKDDQLYRIKIRDSASIKQHSVTIDTTTFQFSNGTLELNSYSVKIQVSKDSLTLEFENENLVLRRISENLRNVDVNSDCFRNSYAIQSKYHQDSVSFVNDSLLIYTGDHHLNSPGKKWDIYEYKGFKFLNIHDHLEPVLLITSCSSSGIDLKYLSNEVLDIEFEPITGQVDKNQLIGNWKEIENISAPPPPPHPDLTKEDFMFSIEIDNDSINITKYGRSKIHKWDLTSDGKRIYFMDSFLDNKSSWKLLNVSDSSMTVMINSSMPFEEEIVKFEKIR